MHYPTDPIISTVHLLLGSIQLISYLRTRYPTLHRWTGRMYIFSSLLIAAGSLAFISLQGTAGGLAMDVGFSIYSLLLFVSALETYRYAAKGRFYDHRVWALRLYALAAGSLLYRMYYGCWLVLAAEEGHTPPLNGIFDQVMAFCFYLPNLLLVEIFIRQKWHKRPA